MGNFMGALLRLKEQLGVEADKDVAELLGLSAKAFASRKNRDAFPEDKLRALVTLRPDLLIDPTYVLTGDYLSVAQAKAVLASNAAASRHLTHMAPSANEVTDKSNRQTSAGLTTDELELLELFRAASLAQKMQAVAALSASAKKKPASKPKPAAQESGIKISGTGHRVAGRDYHEKE